VPSLCRDEQKTKGWPSQSRKESILNCLFIENWTSGREATEIGSGCQNRWEWKPIVAACLTWTTLGGNENLLTATGLKWLKCLKER